MNIALKRMTAREYLAWAERQTSGRTELVDGQIVAMNPQRIEHAETKFALAMALQDALAGTSCRVLGDGMGVMVDATTVYEPDALVYCGERLPRGTVVVPAPMIIVEILSPGTKTVDTTKKLEGYFKLVSVRHYLIVDPNAQTIVHHARNTSEAIATTLHCEGEVALDAVNARFPVAACFPV